MKYRHVFHVSAPLEAVADFHRQSASMAAMTPPPIVVRLQHAPETLKSGDEMVFTLWLGPLPIRWHASVELIATYDATCTNSTDQHGFVDRQVHGPFRHWQHRHIFVRLDETVTEVQDEIHAELRTNPYWFLVGLSMWLGMPLLFAYRGWKTRQLLDPSR